jgi:hypothetical protein
LNPSTNHNGSRLSDLSRPPALLPIFPFCPRSRGCGGTCVCVCVCAPSALTGYERVRLRGGLRCISTPLRGVLRPCQCASKRLPRSVGVCPSHALMLQCDLQSSAYLAHLCNEAARVAIQLSNRPLRMRRRRRKAHSHARTHTRTHTHGRTHAGRPRGRAPGRARGHAPGHAPEE